ncbi:hypothetical protein IAU59_002980 [Kwoniella sp. CBS 9459]
MTNEDDIPGTSTQEYQPHETSTAPTYTTGRGWKEKTQAAASAGGETDIGRDEAPVVTDDWIQEKKRICIPIKVDGSTTPASAAHETEDSDGRQNRLIGDRDTSSNQTVSSEGYRSEEPKSKSRFKSILSSIWSSINPSARRHEHDGERQLSENGESEKDSVKYTSDDAQTGTRSRGKWWRRGRRKSNSHSSFDAGGTGTDAIVLLAPSTLIEEKEARSDDEAGSAMRQVRERDSKQVIERRIDASGTEADNDSEIERADGSRDKSFGFKSAIRSIFSKLGTRRMSPAPTPTSAPTDRSHSSDSD